MNSVQPEVKVCPFDAPREAHNEHWSFVDALSISSLYLSTNQTYRGYSLLVFDARHVERIDALSAAEWRAFAADLHVASRAISAALQPDHMNVEQLGNAIAHLHWHLVPRYRTDPRWGGPIWTTNQADMTVTRLAPGEQQMLVEKIRAALAAQ
jgi:diadenosine tetraphosphate (Ap4A) HIT family hydrolase